MKEIIIDSFAGGGGASTGIEMALGRSPDVAINHDPDAVAMHSANHPATRHYCKSVYDVSPREIAAGRPVGLLWASPDCKHFSKAKGGKPLSRQVRDLAWIVVDYAQQVAPRVIILENVEEFADWGPLDGDARPMKTRRSDTFMRWVRALRHCGYQVEWRVQRACDYGAPTIRRRLFLIARNDGLPIVWPTPTHGAPGSAEVLAGKRLPWRTSGEIIDWSIPCKSIFSRTQPLAEATLRRIARGVWRYVIQSADPYLVPTAGRSLASQCGSPPLRLVSAFLAKHYTGVVGSDLMKPLGTITTTDHHSLVAAHMIKLRGTCADGQPLSMPAPTITAGGGHAGLVMAFLTKYYGASTGQSLSEPMHTVRSKHCLGLVTVTIAGEPYVITDIRMRMLQPHELFAAQGFPAGYQIEHTPEGRRLPKHSQIARCGNSVSPLHAAALVAANCPDMALMREAAE